MGFDWKICTALIGAFAAKEVFVAQMGIIYAATDGQGGAAQAPLRAHLRRDYPPLVGFAIMLFCLIGTPCIDHRGGDTPRDRILALASAAIRRTHHAGICESPLRSFRQAAFWVRETSAMWEGVVDRRNCGSGAVSGGSLLAPHVEERRIVVRVFAPRRMPGRVGALRTWPLASCSAAPFLYWNS